jgi:hypothetical protein
MHCLVHLRKSAHVGLLSKARAVKVEGVEELDDASGEGDGGEEWGAGEEALANKTIGLVPVGFDVLVISIFGD